MRKTFVFSAIGQRSILPIGCATLTFFAHHSALAQATTEQAVVVTGEEVPSAYGAPPGFSRARFSNAVVTVLISSWV